MIYFQIFTTFRYKSLKNSDYKVEAKSLKKMIVTTGPIGGSGVE